MLVLDNTRKIHIGNSWNFLPCWQHAELFYMPRKGSNLLASSGLWSTRQNYL